MYTALLQDGPLDKQSRDIDDPEPPRRLTLPVRGGASEATYELRGSRKRGELVYHWIPEPG